MAKKNDKNTKAEENILAVEEALSSTEQFIEKNQKIIMIIVGALVVVVLGYFGFIRFYLEPKQEAAQNKIFMAEKYFELDSLDKALNGDGLNPGFLQIIDEYGFTKAAKLAHYYTGIIYLNKGDFKAAIDHLDKFSSDDVMVKAMAIGATGDAYLELGDQDKAIKYYLKAAELNINEFATPTFLMKAGMASELKKDYTQALKIYERLKKDFPRSNEGRDMDKYINRVKGFSEAN